MPSGMHVVRPLPSPAVLNRRINQRIKDNLTPLVRQHAFFRQVLVAGWQPQHMPKFRGKVTIKNTIVLDITIINGQQRIGPFSPATISDLWLWWAITGTKKHKIRPVRAEYLRFVVDGQFVSTKLVNHPGTKPNREAKQKLRKLNTRLSGSLDPLLKKSVREGMQQ